MVAEQEMIMTDGDTTGKQPQDLQMLAGLPPAGAWLQAHGLMLSEISGTRVTAYIDLGAQHHTPWGVVHGGVYTTAIETVASVGASLAVRERGEFAVGVDQSADFLRSMQHGRIDIVSEPVIQGRVQQLWQVTITRHDDGKAVAIGRVRLQNVPLPPTT
jgi:1,4-dihydroxy-2-naphthoyl-CoA hydrolase